MKILAADIGGSQARILIGDATGTENGWPWETLRTVILPSSQFPDVEALLTQVLVEEHEPPVVACLASAGPLCNQRCMDMTNLPWTLDADALEAHFGFARVHLMNDFAAQAYGLPMLKASELRTLNPGRPGNPGPIALIGAGTGLGMALLAEPDSPRAITLPSESGHADFAPGDEEQLGLLQYLMRQYERVSLEMLLSGHGLERIYCYVARLPGCPAATRLDAAAISAAALAGDAQAAAAVNLFARILASSAGSLALITMARGGVYLSGGIAPKILPFLQQPAVQAAFHNKAPMQNLLQDIPLHVVANEQLGLLGAARMAAHLACDLSGAAA